MLWVCVVMAVVAVVALGVYRDQLRRINAHAEADAIALLTRRAEAPSAAAAEQTTSVVATIDLALLQLEHEFKHQGYVDKADVDMILAALSDGLIENVAWADARGDVRFSVRPAPRGANLGERPAFRHHMTAATPGLYVGVPDRSVLRGTWIVPFSRPLADRHGRFGGVIFVTVHPAYFHAVYGRFTLAPDDAIALIHAEGLIIARTLDPEGHVGQRVRADRPYLRADQPSAGVFRGPGSHDDTERIGHFHRLAGLPLIAVADLSVDSALAPLRARTAEQVTVARWVGALTLALLVAVWVVLLRLEASNRRLDISEKRLSLALSGATEFAWDWEANSELVTIVGKLPDMGAPAPVVRRTSVARWPRAIHPDDRRAVRQAWRAHVEGRTPEYQCEYRVLSEGGRSHWELVRGRATERDAHGRALRISGVVFNIDAMKQAQIAVAHLSERYRSLLESAREGIVVVDREGLLEFMNPAAEQILGWRSDEARGRLAHALFHAPPGTAQLQASWQACPLYASLEDGRPRQDDHQHYYHRSGAAIPVEVGISPLAHDGVVEGALIVFNDISVRLSYQKELERLAHNDALTGIANRRQFVALAEREVRRAEREATPLAALMLDLDHFKAVNDRHGHAVGDELLKAVAPACAGGLRAVDIFGRLGGEEFGVILPGATPEHAREVAQRLRAAIAAIEVHAGDAIVRCAASIGIAHRRRGEALDSILARADRALYTAKETGRNRVVEDAEHDAAGEIEPNPLA